MPFQDGFGLRSNPGLKHLGSRIELLRGRIQRPAGSWQLLTTRGLYRRPSAVNCQRPVNSLGNRLYNNDGTPHTAAVIPVPVSAAVVVVIPAPVVAAVIIRMSLGSRRQSAKTGDSRYDGKNEFSHGSCFFSFIGDRLMRAGIGLSSADARTR